MENQNQKPQRQQQEDDQQQETFTCEICIEPVSKKFKNSNKCVHPFCTDCIQKYIKLKVVEENVSDIKCPAINCNHSFEILSCRPEITNQVFIKWCDALCDSTVLGFPRVYCPNIECSELILNECGEEFDDRLKRCVCPNCRKPFCFRCKVPWHGDDNSCKDNENDAALDRLCTKNKWKRCPKCGHCIEHVSGCNKVRCRCGTVFDYYDSWHRRHEGLLAILFIVCVILVFVVLLVFSFQTI